MLKGGWLEVSGGILFNESLKMGRCGCSEPVYAMAQIGIVYRNIT